MKQRLLLILLGIGVLLFPNAAKAAEDETTPEAIKQQVLLGIGVLLFPNAAKAAEDETTPEAIKQQVQTHMQELDLEEWDRTLQGIQYDLVEFTKEGAREMIARVAVEGFAADPMNILDSLVNILKANLTGHLGLLATLLAIALLTGIVQNMSANKKNGELTSLICYCMVVAVTLAIFTSRITTGREAINTMSNFIGAAFPVLLLMLSATGAANATGIMQPVTSVLTTTVTGVIRDVVLPLVLISGVLAVINHLTDRSQLKEFNKLSRSAIKWIMGFTVTVYLGVCALNGISAKTLDGLSLRTAKYALDQFVPIVGSMVSGTVDTILGSAVLVKNAAGVASIVILCSILLQPVMLIAGNLIMFRLASALSEPVADPRVPKMFSGLGDVLTYLLATVIVLAVMFILTVGILMGMNGAAGGV